MKISHLEDCDPVNNSTDCGKIEPQAPIINILHSKRGIFMSNSLEELMAGLQILGCDTPMDESDVVIFGAPFDSTTSFRPGTRFASQAMRRDSAYLELYSPYQDKSLENCRVHDAGDLVLPFGNAADTLSIIEEATTAIMEEGRMPVMLGGEHLVTLGTIRALAKRYPDLHIIHFDAHTDLRETFFGEALSHATVIRKCWDLLGDDRIHSFGIRSGIKEEFVWAKDHMELRPFDLEGVADMPAKLKGAPVYLTLDLDVLDPAAMPGTGTPEPGGVTFKELLAALHSLEGLNIVGFDINELNPLVDDSGVSTAAACKLLRELLLLFAPQHP